MSKSVLLVTLEYPPHCGGVGHYYNALEQHLPQGSVSVLTPSGEMSNEKLVMGGRTQRSPFFWPMWPQWGRLVVELVKILRRERYDWIAIGQILPIGTAVVIVQLIARFMYPLPVTRYQLLSFTHGMDITTLRGRKKVLARWVLNQCDLVIANSQFTKRAVAALGIASEKIHVLTPCPAQVEVRSQRSEIRMASTSSANNVHSLSEGGYRTVPAEVEGQSALILSVGRLVKRKGFDTVLRVYAKLRPQYPTLELKIIGEGPDRQRLETLARELGLDPAAIFLGAMEPEQIAPWYDRGSVFVLLPRDEPGGDVEGFGMVFLEANAHGVPVVAGGSGGVPEAVVDGRTGYLVDPLDVDAAVARVLLLLDDESLRQQIGSQGRQRVLRDFQWKDRAEQLTSLLSLRGAIPRSSLRAEAGTVLCLSERSNLLTRDRLRNPDHEGNRHVAPTAVGAPRDDRKRISIIIPVYNHALELSRCIESLRSQTLPPTELIIVDDGSTDKSAVVAEAECARGGPWERYELIKQKNAGAPIARNAGFAVSTGSFVLFSDADITWQPTALETLSCAFMENPHASYAYSAFFFGWKQFVCGPFDSERLKRVNYIHTSSLIRREHFPGFDPALKKFQDWDLWLTMLEHGHHGTWVSESLFTVAPRRTGMSYWLPSIAYRIPWRRFGIRIAAVEKYQEAEEVIRRKHHLPI